MPEVCRVCRGKDQSPQARMHPLEIAFMFPISSQHQNWPAIGRLDVAGVTIHTSTVLPAEE